MCTSFKFYAALLLTTLKVLGRSIHDIQGWWMHRQGVRIPRPPRPAANDCLFLPKKYVSRLLYLKLQLQRDELWKVSGRTVLRDPNYWIRFLDPVSRLAIRACPHLYFLCLWKSFFVASDIYLMSRSFWRLVPVEWIWLNCMTKLQFYL